MIQTTRGAERAKVSTNGQCRPAGARGFTLVELLLVVAIIAVLAMVAMPQFLRYQMRSRLAEVSTNTVMIAEYELAYYHANADYVECSVSPTTNLDTGAYPFDSSQPGWEDLGWKPDGNVRCHYTVVRYTNPKGTWVRPTGICDLDNDDVPSNWWVDVDPTRTSSSSAHMVLRPSPSTVSLRAW